MKFVPRGIQPFGADTFTHKEEDSAGNKIPILSNPPNVSAHRDASYLVGIQGAQTACPGQALYDQLQNIRIYAQGDFNAGYAYLPYITTSQPHVANVGQSVPVTVTVKNAGTSTISGASLVYRIVDPTAGYAIVAQGPQFQLGDLTPGLSRQVPTTLLAPTTAHRYIVRWDIQTPGGLLSQIASAPYREEWLSVVLSAGQTTSVNVTLQNTGARTWPAASVRLSYHWVSDVTQRTVVWNGNRALLPSDVQPGQTVTLPIQLTAPVYPTRYRVQYDLVWEGSFWFSEKGTDLWEHTVNVPFDYRAGYQAPSALTLPLGSTTKVPVTITNTGTSTWPSSGGLIVDLGTHWYTAAGTLVTWDGARTPLSRDLGPGQSLTLDATVQSPAKAGSYTLRWDLSFEGVSWFGDKGVAPGITAVTAKAPTYGALYQPGPIGAVAASVTTTVPMTLTNRSDFSWSPGSINLAYHVFDAAGRTGEDGGMRFAPETWSAPPRRMKSCATLLWPATTTARWRSTGWWTSRRWRRWSASSPRAAS